MIQNKKFIVLGLMSGTSADGVDLGVIETNGHHHIKLLEHGFSPYPKELREKILEAYGQDTSLKIDNLEKELTLFHAQAAKNFIEKNTLKNINLVGFHGQTISHTPPTYNDKNICLQQGNTYQIGNGILLSKELGLPVVYDFRSNDMRHDGQGAPLVPIFHWALTTSKPNLKFPLAWINIGGVSNLTFIPKKISTPENLTAFDVGPGNALIDDWISFKTNNEEPFDEDGHYASIGKIHPSLLKKWLSHPYLKQLPPKSMDRHLFHSALDDCKKSNLSLEDGSASLTAFTACCIKKQLEFLSPTPSTLLISGGGVRNKTLYNQLKKLALIVLKTNDLNWPSDAIEAYAFSYLAARCYLHFPITFPGTTKVKKPQTGGLIAQFNK